MRLSEQYTIDWPQVHLDRRAIELSKTKNRSARTVRLNADAIAALESVRPPGKRPKGKVFPRQTGDGSGFDNRSWIDPCMEDAHVENASWHTWRHTFCSWLAMAGASLKDIQEAAGHKTIAMPARYAHLAPEHTQSVVERIARTSAKQAPVRSRDDHRD